MKYIVTAWKHTGFDLDPMSYPMEGIEVKNLDDKKKIYRLAYKLIREKLKQSKGVVRCADDITVWQRGDSSVFKIER